MSIMIKCLTKARWSLQMRRQTWSLILQYNYLNKARKLNVYRIWWVIGTSRRCSSAVVTVAWIRRRGGWLFIGITQVPARSINAQTYDKSSSAVEDLTYTGERLPDYLIDAGYQGQTRDGAEHMSMHDVTLFEQCGNCRASTPWESNTK